MSRNKNKQNAGPRPLIATPYQNWVVQGKNAFRRGDYRQAIANWEKASSAAEQPPEQRMPITAALAEACFREGQFQMFTKPEDALVYLQRAADLVGTDALYAHHVGVAMQRRGRLGDALAWYRKALARDPAFARSAYEICLILRGQNKPVERDPAWQVLTAVQRAHLQGNGFGGPIETGLDAYAAGDLKAAQAALESVTLRDEALPPKLRGIAAAYLGAIAQHNGDAAAALNLWIMARQFGIQSPLVTDNIGLAYVIRAEAALSTGDTVRALEEAEIGLQLEPDNKRLIGLQGFLRFQVGYQLAEQGLWAKALDLWKPVTALGGVNGRNLAANRAIAYEKLEQHKQAADAWREFVRRRPRRSDSEDALTEEQVSRLWSRVSTLYMKANAVEEAIDSIQTALKYQPEDVQLGLALAHRYLEAERDSAAANQVERLYKAHPKNIEVLVLRAEMAEMGITARGVWRFSMYADGIDQWADVYATGDESYAPLARERLEELYSELVISIADGPAVNPEQVHQHALKTLPDSHFLRAMYATYLMHLPRRRKDTLDQIAKIDLADDEALHQLIDGWHIAQEPKQAQALLEQSEAIKTHDSEFYLGIARCASNRSQFDIADLYHQEALRRAADLRERQHVLVAMALIHTVRDPHKAIAMLKAIVREDKTCLEALFSLTLGYQSVGNMAAARQSLRDAERVARASKDALSIQMAQELRERLSFNPGGLPGLGGALPALPPGMSEQAFIDMVENMDADTAQAMMDDLNEMLNNRPNNPPVSDRRRRRMEKQNPPDQNS